jgi:hypothetical protein
LFSSCTTIENRTKPPPIEYFDKEYEVVYKDLIKYNSFSFIYKNETYNLHPAMTYLDIGPQEYYLGYKNGKLSYIILTKDILSMKEIFESKDKLYTKTQKIVNQLDKLNQFPAKSRPFEMQPPNPLLIDLAVDLLIFTVNGSTAMMSFPWLPSYRKKSDLRNYNSTERLQEDLDKMRLGMMEEEVSKILPESVDEKKIDQYLAKIYTYYDSERYTNALLIFENRKLVGMIRNVTAEPISKYYKKL